MCIVFMVLMFFDSYFICIGDSDLLTLPRFQLCFLVQILADR